MGQAGKKEKQTKKSSTVRETAQKNSTGKAKSSSGRKIFLSVKVLFSFVIDSSIIKKLEFRFQSAIQRSTDVRYRQDRFQVFYMHGFWCNVLCRHNEYQYLLFAVLRF